MKTLLCFCMVFVCNYSLAQGPSNLIALNNKPHVNTNIFSTSEILKNRTIGSNGFNFELLDAGANTRYSEIGSGFFKDKLIMVSSKKLGAMAKIDPNTNEAYKELFC